MLAPTIPLFASLLALAASQCSMPAGPLTSSGFVDPGVPFIQTTLPDGTVQIECPPVDVVTGGSYLPYGNLGAGGPLVVLLILNSRFICDPAVGKFFFLSSSPPKEFALKTLTCFPNKSRPPGLEPCIIEIDGTSYAVADLPQTIAPSSVCPAGYTPETPQGTPMPTLSCEVGGGRIFFATYPNGTKVPLTEDPKFECVQVTTTTTTSTTTTTTKKPTTTTQKPDSPATSAQLWNVNYYYNYGVGVHAFCADQTCINAIQKNGIGYDMVNGKGMMGRAVSESMINSVRASCPKGSANLRNLGFTKSGNKYLHNLSGSGLKQGWVAISNGACGAKVPIKRWKSRYTDDMMYGVDLEWNTWYQGMVQDGGKVQFYMWA